MFKLTMPPVPIATSKVLFDISRLMRSRNRVFATGVDRIDLAIGLNLVKQFRDACHFLYAGSAGITIVPQREARWLLETLDSRWNGAPAPRDLGNGAGLATLRIALGSWMRLSRKPVVTADTTYVVASHSGLGKVAGGMRRLDPAAVMKRFVYIHDIIPLEMPEYQRPETAAGFESFLRELTGVPLTIASNSKDTDRLVRALAEKRRWQVDAFVVLMPTLRLEPAANRLVRSAVDTYLSKQNPFFTVIGTIEPRKNHLLLLNLWRQIVSENDNPPRLCIIGKRGWENENVLDMLDRCEAIRDTVTEFSDLNDGEVQAMMTSSAGLLFPSFIEGLGIPLLEAAALQLPCIVSDIPVFHEIAPPDAVFLDPLDGPGWKRAILSLAQSAGQHEQV